MTATFTPAASPVVIEVPVYMLHNGHAVLALTAKGPKLRDVFLSEANAVAEARSATRWYGVRHITAAVRGGRIEVVI